MTDYNKIRRSCEKESKLTADVLDNFLLYYAGEKEKLPKKFVFEKTPEPEEAAMVDNLNVALKMALPYINSGIAPDLDTIAKETGLPVETVTDLLQHVMGKVDKVKKKGRK